MTRDSKLSDQQGRDWIIDALTRFERPLTLYTSRILAGDRDRARDVVQEAFLRLCEQRPDQVEGRVAEWLFRVCRNLALDHRRKEDRMSMLSDEEAGRRPSAGPAPSDPVEQGDTLEHVLELMRRLPTKQQEVLRLKFQHGLSYKEISRITKESMGNVGWLIHVGIRKLREELAADETKGMQA